MSNENQQDSPRRDAALLLRRLASRAGVLIRERMNWMLKHPSALITVIVLLCLGWAVIHFNPGYRIIPDYSPEESKKTALNMIVEANKNLISLTTIVIGALAVAVNLSSSSRRFTLLVAMSAFVGSLFYGYKTIARLIEELSQDTLLIKPRASRALYFLDMQFWCFLAAVICVLVVVFPQKAKNR